MKYTLKYAYSEHVFIEMTLIVKWFFIPCEIKTYYGYSE